MALRFHYEDDTFRLPWARITGMELSNKPGAKAQLSAAVSWVPKIGKPVTKLLTITYKDDEGTSQMAVFEIAKDDFQSIRRVLEARAGKPVHELEWGDEPISAEVDPPPPPPSPLVPVTITSSPKGAMVFFWGQPAGKTPLTTRLAPGSYTVKIVADGLPAWTRDVEVEPGTPLAITADLSKREPSSVVVIH